MDTIYQTLKYVSSQHMVVQMTSGNGLLLRLPYRVGFTLFTLEWRHTCCSERHFIICCTFSTIILF